MYMLGGGGLGSEITPWVQWVTGDEALGPIVGADSELVSRAPTGRGTGFLCMSGLIVCVENLGCTLLELAVHVARISRISSQLHYVHLADISTGYVAVNIT